MTRATTRTLSGDPQAADVREALRRLGVDRLVFGVHEAALPSTPGLETGRGCLAGRGGLDTARWAASLGFDGLQLGPSGMTGPGNPSPYDGTAFSKSLLSLDVEGLATDPEWAGLVRNEDLAELVRDLPDDASRVVPYETVWKRFVAVAGRAAGRLLGDDEPEVDVLREGFERWAATRGGSWLDADASFEVLAAEHGSEDWRSWPAPDDALPARAADGELPAVRRFGEVLSRRPSPAWTWRIAQWILAMQRDEAHRRIRDLGLALYGDLQVGLSARDEWRLQRLFLPGYRLGAPPSRTNPDGQPWGYPVWNPDGFLSNGRPGPVLGFFDERFDAIFEDVDALRIDHPHGLVCPWVYRTDHDDPLHAVQTGARLFSTPEEQGHPVLARFAIPRPDQIDPSVDPWDDRRVRDLEPEQLARYSLILDRAVAAARRHGRSSADLVCEVLSTMPRPLELAASRWGLGRFRVAQKADLDDPTDVYRSENARPEDWVMLGTHDTRPIRALADGWVADGTSRAWGGHLARVLETRPERRETFSRRIAGDAGALIDAMFAELLACRARHVSVFFTDLLGFTEPYNRPGRIDAENWRLRIPPDFGELYARRVREGTALDLRTACALALRSRSGDGDDAALADRLERRRLPSP